MPTRKISGAITQRNELLTTFGFTPRKLETAKPKFLSEAQQAKLLGTIQAQLKTPIVLSPAKPVKGKSMLTIFTSLMVDPKYPDGVGQALFSSAFPGAVLGVHKLLFQELKPAKCIL
jgi:hypothetical protein